MRLRIAAVADQELLTAGVDAVSIDDSRPGEPPAGSNLFRFGKLKTNRAKGTATLAVTVPGPGKLSAKAHGLIKPVVVNVAKAGTVKIALKPTASGLKALKRAHSCGWR